MDYSKRDYDALIVEANTKEGFGDHLEDERINNNEYKVIFSHEIEDTNKKNFLMKLLFRTNESFCSK